MRSLVALLLASCSAASLVGCGKKGPPLPPQPGSIPRIDDLEVRQVGEEARATFTLPHRPGESEVDYVTLGLELWRRDAELGPDGSVASMETDDEPGLKDFTSDATLVAEARGDSLFDFLARPQPELADPRLVAGGLRFCEYAVVLKTNLRKRGTVSNVVLLDPIAPPPPPARVWLEPQEEGVVVQWEEPGHEPVAESAPAETEIEDEPEPAEDAPGSLAGGEEGLDDEGGGRETEATVLQYDVHRGLADRPVSREPLNDRPLAGPPYRDADVLEGFIYRYVVRSLIDRDGTIVSSRPSAEVSVLFRDSFPPAVPTGLRLILEGSGEVNLLWNPSTAPDIGGYGIYRRVDAGPWVRLDGRRTKTATFTDTTGQPGQQREYAVTAYDRSQPANESEKCRPRAVPP